MIRLFVYGTLKRGFCREHYLSDSSFIGVADTVAAYRLLDCGDYPALVTDGQSSIRGELYDVTEAKMSILDRVECVEFGLYQRATIQLANGSDAITYVYLQRTDDLAEIGNEWTRQRRAST